MPSVSIGMPVYNGEPYIYKALDSLLAQTYTDFELIISDNASTDSTPKICKEYAARDFRIRYIRQPKNMGAFFNFNFVLSQARSEYFMWAAADDVWDLNCLSKWTSILTTHHDVALVFSSFGIYLHNSDKVLLMPFVSPSLSRNKSIRLIQRLLNGCPNMFYGLFRRSMLEGFAIEDFDWFDVYFTNYLSLKGKIVVLSDYLFYSGVKENDGLRRPYSVGGSKIKAKKYTLRTAHLILRHNSFLFGILSLIVLAKQVIGFKKSLREHEHNKGPLTV